MAQPVILTRVDIDQGVVWVLGITAVGALVAIYSLNSAMILFGWLQERYEQPRVGRGAAGLLPYIFGCMVGIVP